MIFETAAYTVVMSLVSVPASAFGIAFAFRSAPRLLKKCLLLSAYLSAVGGLHAFNLFSLFFQGFGYRIAYGFFILGLYGLIFVLPYFAGSLSTAGKSVFLDVLFALAASLNVILRMVSGLPVPDIVLVLAVAYTIFRLSRLPDDPSVPDFLKPLAKRLAVFFLAAFPLVVIDLSKNIFPGIRNAVMAFFPMNFSPAVFAAFSVMVFMEGFRTGHGKRARTDTVESSVSPKEDALRGYGLSSRELETARLILDGLSNAEIADALFISESTVKKHVNAIFRKTGSTSRIKFLSKLKTTARP